MFVNYPTYDIICIIIKRMLNVDSKVKITYGCSGLYTIRALPFNEHTKEEIAENSAIQLQQTGIPDQFDAHIHLNTDSTGAVTSIENLIGHTPHIMWENMRAVDIEISDNIYSPHIKMFERY